jgi:hypothetical protein
MIDPTMHAILLPLQLQLVSCSRSGRPGGALPRKMASQTTLETSSTCTASLSWCTVHGWGIRVGALLHALARWLLPVGSRWLLLRPLHLEARTLGLNVRSLRQKLRGDTCTGIGGRFIWSGLKNWLGCEKRGLTLLPEDYPKNDTFLFPSFSISFILFSITMALSTMCWMSA